MVRLPTCEPRGLRVHWFQHRKTYGFLSLVSWLQGKTCVWRRHPDKLFPGSDNKYQGAVSHVVGHWTWGRMWTWHDLQVSYWKETKRAWKSLFYCKPAANNYFLYIRVPIYRILFSTRTTKSSHRKDTVFQLQMSKMYHQSGMFELVVTFLKNSPEPHLTSDALHHLSIDWWWF